MADKINQRVKDAVKKRQEEGDPKEHMPYLFSPEGFLMLIWAAMLDFLGIISSILTFVFGVGLIFSFMVDMIGMITIGLYMWMKTKKMPHKNKWTRFAKRYGLTSLSELVPLWGDVMYSWTIYLFLEMRR